MGAKNRPSKQATVGVHVGRLTRVSAPHLSASVRTSGEPARPQPNPRLANRRLRSGYDRVGAKLVPAARVSAALLPTTCHAISPVWTWGRDGARLGGLEWAPSAPPPPSPVHLKCKPNGHFLLARKLSFTHFSFVSGNSSA